MREKPSSDLPKKTDKAGSKELPVRETEIKVDDFRQAVNDFHNFELAKLSGVFERGLANETYVEEHYPKVSPEERDLAKKEIQQALDAAIIALQAVKAVMKKHEGVTVGQTPNEYDY